MIKKLPENIKEKLRDLIEEWAEIYMNGKPQILIPGIFHNIDKLLLDKTNEIIETFGEDK